MSTNKRSMLIAERRKIQEDLTYLRNSSGITLERGEKVLFATRISIWTAVVPLFFLILFSATLFLLNYANSYIVYDTFIGGFIYPEEKIFGLVSIIGVSILLAYFIFKAIRYYRFRFIITTKRMIIKDDFLANVEVSRLVGAFVNQGDIRQIFNYGDIVFFASLGRMQTVQNVPNPREAVGILEKLIDVKKVRIGQVRSRLNIIPEPTMSYFYDRSKAIKEAKSGKKRKRQSNDD